MSIVKKVNRIVHIHVDEKNEVEYQIKMVLLTLAKCEKNATVNVEFDYEAQLSFLEE